VDLGKTCEGEGPARAELGPSPSPEHYLFGGFRGSMCRITEPARLRSVLLPLRNFCPASFSTFVDVRGGGFSVRRPLRPDDFGIVEPLQILVAGEMVRSAL
jgi:hypothetical protein